MVKKIKKDESELTIEEESIQDVKQYEIDIIGYLKSRHEKCGPTLHWG